MTGLAVTARAENERCERAIRLRYRVDGTGGAETDASATPWLHAPYNIDTNCWPDGLEQPVLLVGRGRDIFTARGRAEPEILITDMLNARMEMARTLISLDCSPDRPELQPLIGGHTIKGYRRRLSDLAAQAIGRERPLDTMLDDIAACSLICRWALTLWPDNPYYEAHPRPGRREDMNGICIGHAPNPTGIEIVPGRADPGAVGLGWTPCDPQLCGAGDD